MLNHTVLKDIKKELSLYEIAILTRSAPSKLLGLSKYGNLRPGSCADVAIYSKNVNFEEMFKKPKLVFKAGELVCKNGEIVRVPVGGVHIVKTHYDANIKKHISGFYENKIATSFNNSEIGNEELQVCANGGKILVTLPN